MRKKNFSIKLLIVILLLSTSFLGFVLSRYDVGNVSSGSCGTDHETQVIAISTNYEEDEIIIAQGESFDLQVTATGQVTGDVWIGYAFWHTGSDGIQLPDTSPFIVEDNLVNEWNDGDDYYAMFAWETVEDPMTRTFRISTESLSGTETLIIQVAGDSDRASNVIAFSITILAPDNDAPDVTITAPTDNSYVGGTSVDITAIVDDKGGSGVDEVWAEITNATYYERVDLSGTEITNYSGTWDSMVVADGDYNLSVKAKDLLGQLNDTESVAIKVDNNAPHITIESIIPNPSNGVTTITVLNSSSDIDGNGIRTTISPPTGGDIHLDLNYQGSNIWNNTFTVTQTGKYLVEVNATDLAGNTATVGPVSVTGDTTLPQIIISSPTEDQVVGGIISIAGLAFGTGSPIASISINDTIWGDVSQSPQIDTATSKASGEFIFFNKSNIAPGFYSVEVIITDLAGNVNSTVRNFEMTANDITPPTVFLSATPDPSNGFTEITLISNEPLISLPSLNITLPNSTVIDRPMSLVDTNTWQADYTVVSDGVHTIGVSYTDLSSNTGHAYETFVGDITAPTITLIVTPDPSNGLTIIEAYNTTEVVTSILANITTPSGIIYRALNYQGSNKWNTSFTVTENGIYDIIVYGTDLAGNLGSDSQSITGDVVGPSILIVSISPNPSIGLTTITVSNSTSDINVNGIRANVTTPSSSIMHLDLVYLGSNLWNVSFMVTEDGAYTIYVNATDVLGDTTHLGPSTIYGDFSSPIITINSPEMGDQNENPPTFNLTIIEYVIDSTWYMIFDGSKWSEATFFTGTTGTIEQSVWDALNNGELIIRFFANDSFGNIGSADTSFIKGSEPSGEPSEPIILITEEQLRTIFTVLGFMAIGGILIVLITNERKRSIR